MLLASTFHIFHTLSSKRASFSYILVTLLQRFVGDVLDFRFAFTFNANFLFGQLKSGQLRIA